MFEDAYALAKIAPQCRCGSCRAKHLASSASFRLFYAPVTDELAAE